MYSRERLVTRLSSIDWDFAGYQSESPFSALHWHPARFASQLPATLIGVLSDVNDVVLDPFVGSGTTVVEAQRLGRRAIGVDVNPIACIVTKAKTLQITTEEIIECVKSIKYSVSGVMASSKGLYSKDRNLAPIPENVQLDKWYTPSVQQDLCLLWTVITQLAGVQRIISDLAFSAVLLPICRETRHWGYVCDNSTPKDQHGGNAFEEFDKILDSLIEAYRQRNREYLFRMGDSGKIPNVEVITSSASEALKFLKEDTVDLVVTSPPYFGVCDYVKSQRLSMEWLDHAIEPLRLVEIGARSKRRRGTAVSEYLAELSDVFKGVRKCLKPGGFCAIIIGESKTRTSVLDQIRDGLRSSGFDLLLDVNRTVSSQRRQAPSITGEHVLVYG
jgi:DNA modification methylase